MNWIAAYVTAVKTNLPNKHKEDVGDELRSLLEETFERERGKRPEAARDEEVLDWISGREHPALIASRYHERRALVGEDSFPLFKLTLRYVLYGIVVAYVAAAALNAITTADFHFGIFDVFANIIHASLLAFACVTVIFHLSGSKLSAAKRLSKWNPKELPDPESKWEQEPWSSSIAGIVFSAIFLLFLNGIIGDVTHALGNRRFERVDFQFVEQAAALLPWINSVLVGSILLHCYMLLKPFWSTTTLAANAILSAFSLFILARLIRYDVLIELSDPAAESAADFERLAGVLNTSLRVALSITILFCAFEIARSLYRIGRLGTRRPI